MKKKRRQETHNQAKRRALANPKALTPCQARAASRSFPARKRRPLQKSRKSPTSAETRNQTLARVSTSRSSNPQKNQATEPRSNQQSPASAKSSKCLLAAKSSPRTPRWASNPRWLKWRKTYWWRRESCRARCRRARRRWDTWLGMRASRALNSLRDQGAAKLLPARKRYRLQATLFTGSGFRAAIQGRLGDRDHRLAPINRWYSLMSSYLQKGLKKVPARDQRWTFQKGLKKHKGLDQVVNSHR